MRLFPRSIITLLLQLSVLPWAAQAQDPTGLATGIGMDDKIPIDPETTVGQLDNGLRYYIRENDEPEKRAYLRLVVNAGSTLEDDDQQGLAHFLEHMAFNGTTHFAKQELVEYMESIGMRVGTPARASMRPSMY